jgi:quercetin dioxygenase-like cupin family protein
MNDGSEEEYGPGDVGIVPPGHNAWVLGNEPYRGIEFRTMDSYAKK